MKYLKYFEADMRWRQNIDNICIEYGIDDYTINPDGTVDVDGGVSLYGRGLTKLPLKFGYVSGYFDCRRNQLTSLEGAPIEVGGDFSCNTNHLKSLEGGPQRVSRSFQCNENKLTSLKGCPEKLGSSFLCEYNQLTSLEGGPKEVGGYFSCSYNKLTSLSGSPEKAQNFECRFNQLVTLEGAPREVDGIFICSSNKLTTLVGAPEEISGNFYCGNNPNLPEEIKDNKKYINKIVKYQNDYNIWRRDGSLDKYRFSDMMKEILDN